MYQPQEATVYLATHSEEQHFDVLVRSFEIFRERSQARGDLWADFAEPDAIAHIRSKVARVEAALRMIKEGKRGKSDIEDAMLDDALDIINYAAFLVRHIQGLYPDTSTTVHKNG